MYCLTVAFLLVSVQGQTPVPTPPPKCCFIRQFEVTMGETGAALYTYHGVDVPALVDIQNTMHYDYYNKTLIMELSSNNPDGTITHTKIIQDHKKGRQYVYDGNECIITQVPYSFREPCIPESAQYMGRTKIGYAINGIDADVWRYKDALTGDLINLVVTTQSCVPIIESVFGNVEIMHETGPSDLAFMFTNFSPGIRTQVFDMPDLCVTRRDVSDVNPDHPAHVARTIKAMSALLL